MITFFFLQSNIYICQVSKYYINPMEGTSESRLDDQTFSFNVMFVAHNIGWLNKLTKSAHIIRLAYYRLNHGAHHIDSFFDFFFSCLGASDSNLVLKCLIDWPGIWRALYHFSVKNHMIQQSRLLDNEHLCKLYHHNRN